MSELVQTIVSEMQTSLQQQTLSAIAAVTELRGVREDLLRMYVCAALRVAWGVWWAARVDAALAAPQQVMIYPVIIPYYLLQSSKIAVLRKIIIMAYILARIRYVTVCGSLIINI